MTKIGGGHTGSQKKQKTLLAEEIKVKEKPKDLPPQCLGSARTEPPSLTQPILTQQLLGSS